MHGLLPIELVREIIAHVLVFPPVALTDEPGTHPKPSWELISAFAVASKTYRTLALEAWFRVFFSKSPADLFFLENHLQGVYSWTRELHCTLSHPALSWDLAPFLHLHTIRFEYPGRIYRLPFIHTSTVTGLELRSTIWPSPFAVQAITDTFPQLRTLRLSQPTIWCGLCNTCCRVRFAGVVPQNLVYTGGLGLPIHYARALSPLPYLHTVRIALPYSPRGTHISLDPTAPPDPNAELWAGECERCVGVMYEDLAFRTRYIARKKGVLLPQLTPSEADAERNRLYRKPPALERVEWVFRESNRAIGEDASDDEGEPGWDEDGGNASDYAASDYGEEEEYEREEMGQETGVEPEQEEAGVGQEQEGHGGDEEQEHSSGGGAA